MPFSLETQLPDNRFSQIFLLIISLSLKESVLFCFVFAQKSFKMPVSWASEPETVSSSNAAEKASSLVP